MTSNKDELYVELLRSCKNVVGYVESDHKDDYLKGLEYAFHFLYRKIEHANDQSDMYKDWYESTNEDLRTFSRVINKYIQKEG